MGGDDEIADQGELQASAGADAVDTGEGDRDQVVGDVDRLLVHPDVPRSVVGSEVQESLDIVTGAKRFARSSQDQHPTVAVNRHVLDRGFGLFVAERLGWGGIGIPSTSDTTATRG